MFKRLQDKLIIVGCGDYGECIPFENPAFEKWILGYALHKELKDKDFKDELIANFPNTRIFEIHTLQTRQDWYLDFLQQISLEKIMQENFNTIPNSMAYPLNEVLNAYNSDYFLCSISYMIALAMYMNYKELHFYGLNMLYDDDYIQKYNIEYWLGRAEQKGVKLVITEKCDLLKCGALYGYEAVNTLGVYQAKYMRELKLEVFYDLKLISESLLEMSNQLDRVTTNLNILNFERVKFLKEILDRHKINNRPVNDEVWNGEDV